MKKSEQFARRLYTKFPPGELTIDKITAARFGHVPLRDVRLDQCPLRTLPEWIYADRKQGSVDGFTKAAQADQACAERLERMQQTLPYALALHQRPIVIPSGQQIQGIEHGR